MLWARTPLSLLLGLLMLFLGLAIVRGWNDDEGILKWNPTWLANFKYSAPIGIRNRGFAYKKRNGEGIWGYKRLPNFPPPPFEAKRREAERGRHLLGWYSGPGSIYHSDNSMEDLDMKFEMKRKK